MFTCYSVKIKYIILGGIIMKAISINNQNLIHHHYW